MPDDRSWLRQAAAIPVRNGAVCLVSSRSGKRWVIPKGIIDPGMTAPETALQESWEEAGLKGELEPEPMGSYLYDKWGGTCHVTVYLMHVTEVAEDWPERVSRVRRWLKPGQVLSEIQGEDLRRIVGKALAPIVDEDV
jgi:8-oxo-dGTP pyrophosphatase MutT (NUDIX family)